MMRRYIISGCSVLLALLIVMALGTRHPDAAPDDRITDAVLHENMNYYVMQFAVSVGSAIAVCLCTALALVTYLSLVYIWQRGWRRIDAHGVDPPPIAGRYKDDHIPWGCYDRFQI